MQPKLILIAAGSKKGRIIGTQNNRLPWPSIKSDFEKFKAVTMGHPVIMGRVTFESLPKKAGIVKPLPGRQNIVITRNPDFIAPENVWIAFSIQDALKKALILNPDCICIMGGEQIYRETIEIADVIYYTEVDLEVEGTTRFPEIPHHLYLEINEKRIEEVRFPDNSTKSVRFCFQTWTRSSH